MASVTFKVNLSSTTNASVYTTGSFTPVASDLLVAIVYSSDTTIDSGFTTSAGLIFTQVAKVPVRASVDTMYVFIAQSLAAASAQTASFDCTGDAATGALIDVYAVSSMTRTGRFAVRQSISVANHAAGIPAPAFSASALTGNPTLGGVANATSPATMTPPTSWTEGSDHGYATPTTGLETVFRNSGFTGTTVTWGSSSASAYSAVIFELDTSTYTAPTVALNAPADTGTASSTTPTLTFTGTDAEGQDIAYEIQIDSVNTFDSQAGGVPLIDKIS